MTEKKGKHYLIVEGGGFKTGFTSGILDAFIAGRFDPFDGYIGVSGGSVAVSYYTSKQYRQTLESILYLAKDSNFVKYRRSLGREGFMDIDTLGRVSTKIIPFDIKKALLHIRQKDFRIVATDRQQGNPVYFKPSADQWIDHVIASCTLPFVTKGKHIIEGKEYFDGGWSDALPVKYAANQGASHITVLRTWPEDSVFNQSWPDFFGGLYFKGTPVLKEIFEKNYIPSKIDTILGIDASKRNEQIKKAFVYGILFLIATFFEIFISFLAFKESFVFNIIYVLGEFFSFISILYFFRGFVIIGGIHKNHLLQISAFLIIVFTLFLSVLDIATLYIESIPIGVVSFLKLLTFGPLSIIFGIALLKLTDFKRLVKWCGILEIITGVSLLLVFLAPVALFTQIIVIIFEIILIHKFLTKFNIN